MGIFSEMDMEMNMEKAYEGFAQEEKSNINQVQEEIVTEPAPVSAVSVEKADRSKTDDEDAKRKAHDEAEAQRKAEWQKSNREKRQ